MMYRAKALASIAVIILLLQLHPIKVAGVRPLMMEMSLNALKSASPISSNVSQDIQQEVYTPEDFASISSAEDWNKWATAVNSGQIKTEGYTFGLSENLDFSKTIFSPVGTDEHPFSGKFEGNGFCLIGINGIADDENIAAPFAFTSGANISKLGVETAENGLYGKSYAAGLVGLVVGQTEISSCYFSGNVSGRITGGLVAEVREKLKIRDCYAIVCRGNVKAPEKLEDTGGVLLGLNNADDSDVVAENFYGISPNRSVKSLFAPINTQQDVIKTSSVYLFNIDSSDLTSQIDASNMDSFDFDDVWKKPERGMLPQLNWQSSLLSPSLKYAYSYGDLPYVDVTDSEDIVTVNTGKHEIMLNITGHENGILHTNLIAGKDKDSYILKVPLPNLNYYANLVLWEHGQLYISQLRFMRIDENSLHGRIEGLDAGEYYTVSLRSTENHISFSENFQFNGWLDEAYTISGIPEGSYYLDVHSDGYYPINKPLLHVDSKQTNCPDIKLYKAINEIKLSGKMSDRVDLFSRNRIKMTIRPKDADISRVDTEVLLNGEKAKEQDYRLIWMRDSFVFTPNVSGAFIIKVTLYDMRGVKYSDSVAFNACREIQSIVLPHTVDITSMGVPVEVTPRIFPTDATDTSLEWWLTSGEDVVSISNEGNTCRLYPQKVGVAALTVRSVNGLEKTIRIRVLDKTPPAFGDTAFENITTVGRVMVSFAVQDDSGIARVTAASKSGIPVSVSKLASEKDSYAFEGERSMEYVITATDVNGNSETMTTMPAELLQSGIGNNPSFTNSGLAVSKSSDSISLWVSANESDRMEYKWQKKNSNGEWKPAPNNASKLEDNDLTANTWYEYRVEFGDENGEVFTRTTAVHTNPMPLKSNDIEINVAGSYDSIYVGEVFPVSAVVSGNVDITGQSFSWKYDENAMVPEAQGGNVFKAIKPGTYPLEYTQTDIFGNTVSTVKMIEILGFNEDEQLSDRRFIHLLLPLAVCVILMSLIFILKTRKKIKWYK